MSGSHVHIIHPPLTTNLQNIAACTIHSISTKHVSTTKLTSKYVPTLFTQARINTVDKSILDMVYKEEYNILNPLHNCKIITEKE